MDIQRRSVPTKLDSAPKGSRCFVSLFPEVKDGVRVGETKCIVYVQISKDESNPVWEQQD